MYRRYEARVHEGGVRVAQSQRHQKGKKCKLRSGIERLRACLQVGEVTCGGLPHLACKRYQIKMRDYMDRRVTPPKRVTSSTWGPPPPCKQALILKIGLS